MRGTDVTNFAQKRGFLWVGCALRPKLGCSTKLAHNPKGVNILCFWATEKKNVCSGQVTGYKYSANSMQFRFPSLFY